MLGPTESLLSEIAKPVEQINKDKVLSTIRTIDAGDPNESPMIFFLLESLFDFVKRPESTILLKDLLKAILENATLLPILYQVRLPASSGQDKELDQILSFVQSFK